MANIEMRDYTTAQSLEAALAMTPDVAVAEPRHFDWMIEEVNLKVIVATVDVVLYPHDQDTLVTHKDGLPLDRPFKADTLRLSPGQRNDVILRLDNPGRWIAHDHIEHHVSGIGKKPGREILNFEYEDVPRDDDWYVWKGKEYLPDFRFPPSLRKGPDVLDVQPHEGTFPDIG